MEPADLKNLTRLIRYYILVSTTAAGSGHPTTSLSATDLMTVLFFKYLRADLDQPQNPANDRVIFSKGHAAPLLYALYAAAGKLTEQELLTLRTFDSPLEGHPVPRFRYTEAATGSLGQGLAVGVGEALAISLSLRGAQATRQSHVKTKQEIVSPSVRSRNDTKVFVLLGDGELAEGSVWEAAAAASYYKLNNLIAIADINGLGQSQGTMYNRDIEVYAKRFEAFGWRVIFVEDGHSLKKIDTAFRVALSLRGAQATRQSHVKTKQEIASPYERSRNDIPRPTILIARTIKGKGVSFLEGKHGWHGKALSKEELERALAELGKIEKGIRGTVGKPEASARQRVRASAKHTDAIDTLTPLTPYDKPVATRKAFGNALVRLGRVDPAMVVLDADVQNSTYTEFFAKAFPDRFFQMFIAEQTMVGVALGLSKQGFNPCIATFACFLTRAFDQIRMAALSQADIKICGSHAGVSIGQDGGSQMGLEDLAMFRAVAGSTVLYPSDAISTEKLVEEMTRQKGIVYLRTTRGEMPVIYSFNDAFKIGGSHVFDPPSISQEKRYVIRDKQNGKKDMSRVTSHVSPLATIVAAGITVHEALKAQKALREQGIGVRVIDCYSIKPIDEKTLRKAASETKAMIVVEDHYPEGGLGEAVLSTLQIPLKVRPLKVVHLAVRKIPRSAPAAELLAHQEIDAAAIVKAVKSL